MHRSGTSALAGILHKNNIVMGEEHNFLPTPSKENPKGFFENYLFRKLNDKIVQINGYKIKSWSTDIPKNIKAGIVNKYRMRRLIKKYDVKYKDWGWKDPRTCLTLELWLEEIKKLNLLNKCRILYILRNSQTVAKSMVKRGNTDYQHALLLWQEYNSRVSRAIKLYKPGVFYLKYEDLCNKPIETSKSIFSFLRKDFDRNTIIKFIDKDLNRSVKTRSQSR